MRSRALRFTLILVCCLPVAARAAKRDFNVPAQSADRALLAFSEQAGAEVLFSFEALKRATSHAVAGSYEPDEALAVLLQGTAFVGRQNGVNKYVITPATPSRSAIGGRLIFRDGTPAAGVRMVLPELKLATLTDANGAFLFSALPAGTYWIASSDTHYQPVRLTGLRVNGEKTLKVDTQTLLPADEPTRLDRLVVEGHSETSSEFGRDRTPPLPQTAVGNLDLPRSEEDVLPFTIYDRHQIQRSGAVNLNEFLQRQLLDSDAAARPSDQDGTAESFVANSSNVKLRGYGADETIVLVNGRRLPETLNSFSAYNSSQKVSPEVNFIPLSLVERVEVLPVSASALYSGNPVGGVINIVLRPDVETTEVTATTTNALGRFDAPQSNLSLLNGRILLGGKLHVRVNASFTRTLPPTEAELGYIRSYVQRHPPADDRLYRATPNVRSADGSPLTGLGSPFTSVAPGADGNGGLNAFGGRGGVRSLALFDSIGGFATSPDSLDNPYGHRQRGDSYSGSVTYDLFPWLQAGVDGTYSRATVDRGYNVFPGNLTLAGTSPLNPFHQDLLITLNESTPALGENYSEAKLEFSSLVGGLMVTMPAGWKASLDAQYGHNVTHYRGVASVDAGRWQELVDTGAYNPLRDTQAYGPPAAFYDRALVFYGSRGQFRRIGDYETVDAALRVTNRTLTTPLGTMAVSGGADYRRAELQSYLDERRYGDGSLAAPPDFFAGRTLERASVFGEVQAPLVPSRWLPRWLKAVEADVAARYVMADTSQETNVAPTGGLKFAFPGGVSLRGSIATSNRLPSPYMSHIVVTSTGGGGGGTINTAVVNDPLRNERYSVPTTDAVNPNLRPEAAVTRTLGVFVDRGDVHHWRLGVDFVDTRKSGEQTYLSTTDVLNLESQLPGRVTRAPLAPGDPHHAGVITSILTGNFNLAWRESQNWSTSLNYAWRECFGGTLEAYAQWMYFQRFAVELLPGSPIVDELNHPDGATAGLLRHRANFGVSWSNPSYGFGVDGHYYHSRTLPASEWVSQGSDHIAPFRQFDAFVQTDILHWLPWKFTRFGLRGQLRVNNVLNSTPPAYADDPSGAGVQSYGDWRGRVYSLSVTATF